MMSEKGKTDSEIVERDNNVELISQVVSHLMPIDSQKNSPGKRYTDEQKILALTLYSAGYTYDEICKAIGVPSKGTIHNWINSFDIAGDAVLSEQAELIKKGLSARYHMHSSRLSSEAMKQDKLDKSSTLQLITAAGIMTQRALELEGKAPGQQGLVHINQFIKKFETTEDKLDQELQELEGKL